MSSAEPDRQLQVPARRITAIINGQRTVAGDTAPRPGNFSAGSVQFRPVDHHRKHDGPARGSFVRNHAILNDLQALCDLRMAASKVGKVTGKLPTLERRGKSSRRLAVAA